MGRPGARADVVRDAVVPDHNNVNCITICKYNVISQYRIENQLFSPDRALSVSAATKKNLVVDELTHLGDNVGIG